MSPPAVSSSLVSHSLAVVRPLKVVALICCCAVVVLFTLALASTDWLLTDGWRQGLFTLCADNQLAPPTAGHQLARPTGASVQISAQSVVGCGRVHTAPFLLATQTLCGLCLAGALLAAVATGAGLHSVEAASKRRLYCAAAVLACVSLTLWLLALLLYPVGFVLRWASVDGRAGEGRLWQFGWAYGLAWGAAVFLCAAAVLLICDRESEQVYVRHMAGSEEHAL